MLLQLPEILTEGLLQEVRSALEQEQASDLSAHPVSSRTMRALFDNPLFMMAAQPRLMGDVVYKRHSSHTEQPSNLREVIVRRPEPMRVDLRVIIFLSEPHEYGDGEVILKQFNQNETFKAAAGCGLLFPAGTSVGRNAITSGAAWTAEILVQSLIRNKDEREVLYDIAYSRAMAELLSLTNQEGLDRLRFCETELLRCLAET